MRKRNPSSNVSSVSPALAVSQKSFFFRVPECRKSLGGRVGSHFLTPTFHGKRQQTTGGKLPFSRCAVWSLWTRLKVHLPWQVFWSLNPSSVDFEVLDSDKGVASSTCESFDYVPAWSFRAPGFFAPALWHWPSENYLTTRATPCSFSVLIYSQRLDVSECLSKWKMEKQHHIICLKTEQRRLVLKPALLPVAGTDTTLCTFVQTSVTLTDKTPHSGKFHYWP